MTRAEGAAIYLSSDFKESSESVKIAKDKLEEEKMPPRL